MIRIIFFCCMALAVAQASPAINIAAQAEQLKEQIDKWEDSLHELPSTLAFLGIKSSKDIINFVNSFKFALNSEQAEQLDLIVQFLQDPKIMSQMDLALQTLPELGPLFHGVRTFLDGPDGKPLLDAVAQVLPEIEETSALVFNQLLESYIQVYPQIAKTVEDINVVLQTPEVKGVFPKFLALPEVIKLDEIGQRYGLNVLGGLNELNAVLNP
ncbi:unnamed protein product [Allacma fusca]|uniref:Uncharacterized protein n=1 Tax=Allacma fusca TaxID=39272 RepID=A0A8J2MDG3_9HEXA|nr:unnamed protein product [Allacma fusca]